VPCASSADLLVVFGWLSDKIGRKPIIMAGMALAIVCTFRCSGLTWPPTRRFTTAQQNTRARPGGAPGDCRFSSIRWARRSSRRPGYRHLVPDQELGVL
jgi:hypothetical protein